MDPDTEALIAAIHQSSTRWVLALAGGGALGAAQLLSVPGASRSVLEIIVPYHPTALTEFLGHAPAQSCSADTSRAMAQRALERARWLVPGENAFGLGSTASLVSDRPKRGEHRIHVSVAGGDEILTWSLVLRKRARDRPQEEVVAAALVLRALGQAIGSDAIAPLTLLPGESLEGPLETGVLHHRPSGLLDIGAPLFVAADGQLQPDVTWAPDYPMALVPGSFNPLHGGHWRLAEAAHHLSDLPVAFEMSIANVDKPDLSIAEIRRRLAQFTGHAAVWLTRAPRFTDKARLFPGAVFAVGADTAARLVDRRYYDNDPQRMLEALASLRDQGCRFLVAGRTEASGTFCELANLTVPQEVAELFSGIEAHIFRADISSSEVRARLQWSPPHEGP